MPLRQGVREKDPEQRELAEAVNSAEEQSLFLDGVWSTLDKLRPMLSAQQWTAFEKQIEDMGEGNIDSN